MTPRTTRQILEQAEQLAARFEGHQANAEHIKDAKALRAVRQAFLDLAEAEGTLEEAVIEARRAGHSWAVIGTMLGTSGEAARQRYSPQTKSR